MNGITGIPSAMQSAVNAINRSQTNLAADATVVASSSATPTQAISRDTLEALIDSRQQVLYTAAAARLISASDEITRSLIDVTA
jgi:hypothetical protein